MRSIVNSTLRACSSRATPRRRGPHAAPRAQQQRRAQVAFELRDALADGRRLDVLLGGRACHVLVVAHRHQQAQGLEVDVAHGPHHLPVWVSEMEFLTFQNTSGELPWNA
jgi:hypothetical protein